jgi:hypothetical protein
MIFQDLGVVREVRNSFAHQHCPARFEDPEVTVCVNDFVLCACTSWSRRMPGIDSFLRSCC